MHGFYADRVATREPQTLKGRRGFVLPLAWFYADLQLWEGGAVGRAFAPQTPSPVGAKGGNISGEFDEGPALGTL